MKIKNKLLIAILHLLSLLGLDSIEGVLRFFLSEPGFSGF